MNDESVPYVQITKEALSICPEITGITVGRGCTVRADSLVESAAVMAKVTSDKPLSQKEKERLRSWLTARICPDGTGLSIEYAASR